MKILSVERPIPRRNRDLRSPSPVTSSGGTVATHNAESRPLTQGHPSTRGKPELFSLAADGGEKGTGSCETIDGRGFFRSAGLRRFLPETCGFFFEARKKKQVPAKIRHDQLRY